MNKLQLQANQSMKIGNIILSIGRETQWVALFSPNTNEFIKLNKSKTNRILRKVKKNLRVWLNCDETFNFGHMTPDTTNQLIDILKGK